MAYSYSTVNSDAAATATYAEGRINAITGTPTLSAPIVDTSYRAFLQAQADGMLGTVGYIARDVAAGTATNSSGPTSFTDVPGFSSATINVPVAKTYLVHVDLNCFASVLNAGNDVAIFKLYVGSNNVTDASMVIYFEAVNIRKGLSFRAPLAFAAGNNTVKLQWSCTSVSTTLDTDTRSFRCFTVTG